MKNLTKTTLTMLAVGLLCSGLFCQQAQAVPIQGTIFFGGVATLDSTSVGSATQVTTWNAPFVNQAGTGSFSGIPFGTSVTMTGPWTFNSGLHLALWSVGGFTFDLTSSSILFQSSTFLNITGIGIVFGNGFTPTPGQWDFTVTKSDGKMTTNFGFQAQTAAVPDGGSAVALLGIALVGLEGLRRKLKAS
jgi:hypothetical protein